MYGMQAYEGPGEGLLSKDQVKQKLKRLSQTRHLLGSPSPYPILPTHHHQQVPSGFSVPTNYAPQPSYQPTYDNNYYNRPPSVDPMNNFVMQQQIPTSQHLQANTEFHHFQHPVQPPPYYRNEMVMETPPRYPQQKPQYSSTDLDDVISIQEKFNSAFDNQPLPSAIAKRLSNIFPAHQTPLLDSPLYNRLENIDNKELLVSPPKFKPATNENAHFSKPQNVPLLVEDSMHVAISESKMDESVSGFIEEETFQEEAVAPIATSNAQLIEDDGEDEEEIMNEHLSEKDENVEIVDDEEEEVIEEEEAEEEVQEEEVPEEVQEDDIESEHLISEGKSILQEPIYPTQPESPVRIQSSLETERFDSKIPLFSWCFVFEYKPKEDLFVHLLGKTSPEGERNFTSSFIVHRINPITVLSENGSKYELASPIDIERNQKQNESVVSKEFLQKFCGSNEAFPKNWKDLVRHEFERLEKNSLEQTGNQSDLLLDEPRKKTVEQTTPQKPSSNVFQNDFHDDFGFEVGGLDTEFDVPSPINIPSKKKSTEKSKKAARKSVNASTDEEDEEEEYEEPTKKAKKGRPSLNDSFASDTSKKKRKSLNRSSDEEENDSDYTEEVPAAVTKRGRKSNNAKKSASQAREQEYHKRKRVSDSSDMDEDIAQSLLKWRKRSAVDETSIMEPLKDQELEQEYYETPTVEKTRQVKKKNPAIEKPILEKVTRVSPPKPSTKKSYKQAEPRSKRNTLMDDFLEDDDNDVSMSVPPVLIPTLPPRKSVSKKRNNRCKKSINDEFALLGLTLTATK